MEKQITEFWTWFKMNEERLWEESNSNPHEILNEIKAKLEFASDSDEYGIALELSKNSDGKKRLEISADGVKELFDTVIKITAAAPNLGNWGILAFKQPVPTPFCLCYNEMEFETSKMVFMPFENEDNELNIIVFGDNFKNYNENELFHYGLTVIDNLIGEYNCVMKVKGYDFVDKEEIGDNETYSLEELPDFIDYYYSNDSEQ